jgi:hypothetical protein
MHEASLHEQNQFITLTYDNEHLPKDEGLNHKHFQDFIKRYRDYLNYRSLGKITYYMCGEYGENFGRPHYHALIFGHRFHDLEQFGKNLWNSKTLEKLWGKGFTSVGNVTLNSAAYVSRYIMKKMTGDKAKAHYRKAYVEESTGEITETFKVQPEYNRMSCRPAIGKEWYEKFKNDVDDQKVHINGKEYQVPKYYLQRLKAEDPARYEEVMTSRSEHARTNQRTPEQMNALANKYNHQYRNNRSLK